MRDHFPHARAPGALVVIGLLLLGRAAHAEDWSAWKHQNTLRLDTTRAGAQVKGDVRDYPLVVVLDQSNFDFAQAQPTGADLRFTRAPAGEPMPMAIEHWDQAGRRAAVWVKVDVIKGNSKAQTLTMHWGNPAARDASDGKAVFDVKQGFVGVYHLGGSFDDATANQAHLTGVNVVARKSGDAPAEGRVGPGLLLDYAQVQWLKLDEPVKQRKRFDLTTRGTFSVWAKARRYLNKGDQAQKALPGYETMFAKGDNSWRLQKFGIRDWHKPAADLIEMCVERPPSADLCVVGKTDMVPGKWFHVVAVHDFPRAKIYVNGVLEKADTFDFNWVSGDHPVGLGNQSQFPGKGRQWDGWLDEARVLEVVKDDHWIKLDYESQREDSKLISFGKPQNRS